MQQRLVLIVLTVAVVGLVVILWFALGPASPAHAAQALSSLAGNISIPATDPTPTATAQPPSSGGGGLDPAVVVAIITAVVALVAALIAGGIAVFQTLYAARVQRESSAKQERHDQEMERLRRELDEQYKRKEQEEQRKVDAQEATRREMLLAQNNEARAKAYRRALHADPRISRLQILDMTRPLEVTNVYVRVRVHEEAKLRYDVDPLLVGAAEQQRDPNALLRAGRIYLERRVSSAIDPDAAISKYRRCAIVGDPGAGKTTLLKFLTLKAADNALKDLPDLPIHIELSAFASSEQQDLLDFAATVWDERYAFFKTDARAYMDEMLKAGKAWLLLDALDETVIGEKPELAEASYQRVSEAIMRTATRYPDAAVVVTARKAGYQQRSPLIGFTELEVVDFRREDDVQVGPNVQFLTPTHPLEAEARRAKLEAARPITVGDNVCLGGGVIILPGVSIGENTVVGAGAVVTRDLPANVVAVGNPARVIRSL